MLPAKVRLHPIEANNEPGAQTAPATSSDTPGYDKLKAAADKLSPPKGASEGQNKAPVAPDIAETAEQMAGEDINVEDIPFN